MFYYSKLVPEYLEKPKSTAEKILYRVLQQKSDEQINPLLNPTLDDIDEILSSIEEISTFCIEQYPTIDGVIYIDCKIVISSRALATCKPRELAEKILLKVRKHWQRHRGIDCVPFITTLTRTQLVLALPLSIQGLKTLAKIQAEQNAFAHYQLGERSRREQRNARRQQVE